MPALSRTSSPKTPSGGAPVGDRSAAARVADLFTRPGSRRGSHYQLHVDDGRQAPVPDALADIVRQAAQMLAEGHRVALMSEEQLLTTQEAADLLNVSRQYFVRLVDRGDLAAVKIGRHRRMRPTDVAAYKAKRDAGRSADLDRLVALSEAAGGYDLGSTPR
ncbi:helix-turn-helix domain-containing protein [Brevundimonas sp.]|uniref:helix-turn-helix domain-containing protein n=1 Tax=Brevundimonas sp. TaxID=1871086 RepID=UPI00257FF12D|nr:helix-turn-helix domain-containing protein [Brevundimonas sp.]